MHLTVRPLVLANCRVVVHPTNGPWPEGQSTGYKTSLNLLPDMLMEFRRLSNFLRIAMEGSLGKASRALGIAQPALGRQMLMLESELGVKLFERVPKGMQLTDEGEYLRDALQHPLEQVEMALRNVRSYSERVEASLVLGLPPVVARFFGPRLIGRLRRDFPHLGLKIANDESAKLAADLACGLVDIAILVGVHSVDKVVHVEVLSEPLMLVVPPDSQLAKRDSVTFVELQELPLILPGTQAGLRTKLTKAALTAELSLNIAMEIDCSELAKQAVKAKLGYAILPPLAFKLEAERAELIGIPITDPDLDQLVFWAVRTHWRVRRSTFDQVQHAFFDEWFSAVSSGEWPVNWMIDPDKLGAPSTRSADIGNGAQPPKPMLDRHRL